MSERFHEYPAHPTDGRRRVYFIRPVGQQGPIKIGVSAHPKARLTTYMSWSPVKLEIIASTPGSLALERAIHNCFADAFLHSEWFEATPRLLKFIADIQAGFPFEACGLEAVGNVAALRRKEVMSRKGTPSETYSL